jgi:RNA polymerase sigma-70 factor (ECF subfamily)
MNREQFISQVESCQKSLRRFLTALCCGDSLLADDIAQESLLKAYMASDSLKDETKFNSWIFKISYNTFLNNIRRGKEVYSLDETLDTPAPCRTDDAFKYQDLYMAFEKLPDKERMSVLLYYIEGYSAKEISEIVDASQDAVAQHLHRGRIHLKELLKPERL